MTELLATARKHWFALLIATIVGLGGVAYFAWWYKQATTLATSTATRSMTEETVVLALCATALAFLAVVAAVVAAWFAWPTFRDWAQEHQTPTVVIGWNVFDNGKALIGSSDDGGEDVFSFTPHQSFPDVYLQVIIRNEGPATVRNAILNIRVLWDCDLDTYEPGREDLHRLTQLPAYDDDIQPGQSLPVHSTVAERDFPPGKHYIYSVKVSFPRTPDTREWPILVVLDGDPDVTLEKRILAKTN
jgi:hypothetical protein